MDQQGFTAGGVGSVSEPLAAIPRMPVVRTASKTPVKTNGTGKPQAGMPPVNTGSTPTIGFLNSFKNATEPMWLVQFLGLLMIPVAWSLDRVGLKSAANGLRGWIIAPTNALMNTRVRDGFHLRANAVDEAAKIMRNVGGDTATKASALETRSVVLHGAAAESGKKWSTWFEPARKWFGDAIDNFSKSGFGKWVEARVKGFTDWRINRHGPKVGGAIDMAIDSIKASPTDVQAKLAGVLTDLQAAKGLTGTTQAAALAKAEGQIGHIVKGVEGAGAQAVHTVGDLVKTAKWSAETLVSHTTAAASGLRAMTKNLLRSAGNIPIFFAVVGAGALAGAAMYGLKARQDNKIARQSLKDMAADIGDAKHPMMIAASKMAKKQSSGRWMSAGLTGVGEGLVATPMGMGVGPGAGKMGMIALGAGFLPNLSQLLVPENHLLNAYATLKQNEQGKITLPPEHKIDMVRHLVAAVPAVNKQGGVDNRLSRPIATEIVKRNLSVKQTLQLLANPEQFTALTSEVAAAQKKIIEEAAAQKKANEETATQKPGEVAATPPVPAKPKTETPSLTINAATTSNEGRLADIQRAMGQV